MTTPEASRGPKRSAQNDCTPTTASVQAPKTEGANRGGADAELTRRINDEHRACERAGRAAVEHAVRCGEMLIKRKAAVGHGAWLRWLAENFVASKDTARVYMRLARIREEVLDPKTERARFFSVRSALSSLAPPPETPDSPCVEEPPDAPDSPAPDSPETPTLTPDSSDERPTPGDDSGLAPGSPRPYGTASSSETPAPRPLKAGPFGVPETPAHDESPASVSGAGKRIPVQPKAADVMLVPGNLQTEAHGALLRHLSGGGDAAMICRVPEEAKNAKEFLSAASRALGAEQREGHVLIYVSQDPRGGKAILKALRRPAPQEKEPCDPFNEDYGDDEEVSEEDRERERYEKRLLRQMEMAERSRVREIILDEGGIRTRDDLREEYRGVPNVYKRRDGLPGDEMAERLRVRHPELGIEDERDLIDVLVRGPETKT